MTASKLIELGCSLDSLLLDIDDGSDHNAVFDNTLLHEVFSALLVKACGAHGVC